MFILFLVGRIINDHRKEEKEEDELEELTEEEIDELIRALDDYDEVSSLYAKYDVKTYLSCDDLRKQKLTLKLPTCWRLRMTKLQLLLVKPSFPSSGFRAHLIRYWIIIISSLYANILL